MEWEYRIIKSCEGEDEFYSVEECLLDSDGIIQSHTIELSPKCETIDELKDTIKKIVDGLDKGILGEIKSTIKDGCCCGCCC